LLFEQAHAINKLCTALSQEHFSFVKLTPSHLDVLEQLLLTEHTTEVGVTRLIVGGEALTGKHLAYWRTHSPKTWIVNEYGPTEATVGCSVFEARVEDLGEGNIPIGFPIENCQLYVLNSSMQPVVGNEPGELYIGGYGLARGYLRRPELTAERFVPHPFSKYGGERLYKTGDLVRYLADGGLEFLGRMDGQIKLRGYRIEPGEITMTLREHALVYTCHVLLQERTPDHKEVVAYVVLVDDHEQKNNARDVLFAHLRRSLPEYMCPAHIVFLKSLPLTPHGKIDDNALSMPEVEAFPAATPLTSPPTPLEEILLDIWTELFAEKAITIHDNFFDLGGHSLLGTKMIARMRKLLRVTIPLYVIFNAPTIASLAQYIDQRLSNDQKKLISQWQRTVQASE
jgi:acyl-coenzyme A synthetase/AMP-(fatty) acid ligase/acyl carrier protein